MDLGHGWQPLLREEPREERSRERRLALVEIRAVVGIGDAATIPVCVEDCVDRSKAGDEQPAEGTYVVETFFVEQRLGVPNGQHKPLHAVVGFDHVEDRACRLLLEPLECIALVKSGRARKFGGRRRTALRERAIEAEPVADVHATQVEGPDRRPEQPLDKSVTARLLDLGAGHRHFLLGGVPNHTKWRSAVSGDVGVSDEEAVSGLANLRTCET